LALVLSNQILNIFSGTLNLSPYQRSNPQNKQKMGTKIQNLMKTNNFLSKTVAMAAILALGFAMSCQEDDTPYAIEASYVAEETVTDYYFEDADDLAGVALQSDEGTSGGRVAEGPRSITINDPRCSCDNLTVTITFTPNSTIQVPVGDIVIDFGEGCEDFLGNIRTGKLLIHFVGRRFFPESFVTLTFDGYTINGIALAGTRTLTNISGSNEEFPKFRVELADGSATWPDGTEATREHCFEREWVRGNNPTQDQVIVNQCPGEDVAATGTNRRGVQYEMTIVEELVYKRGCPIAVSGIKKFVEVATGKEIVIDYGDGNCDKVITILVNGNTRTVNVNRRG